MLIKLYVFWSQPYFSDWVDIVEKTIIKSIFVESPSLKIITRILLFFFSVTKIFSCCDWFVIAIACNVFSFHQLAEACATLYVYDEISSIYVLQHFNFLFMAEIIFFLLLPYVKKYFKYCIRKLDLFAHLVVMILFCK